MSEGKCLPGVKLHQHRQKANILTTERAHKPVRKKKNGHLNRKIGKGR